MMFETILSQASRAQTQVIPPSFRYPRCAQYSHKAYPLALSQIALSIHMLKLHL